MIVNLIYMPCPNCGVEVTADEHDCGCVFGCCEECATDFELDDNCANCNTIQQGGRLWKQT